MAVQIKDITGVQISSTKKVSNLEAMPSSVDHPSHYTFGKYEVIDVIEDWKLGYHLGNAVKYIARAGKKNSLVEDLQKAIWYINRYVENYKESNSDNSSKDH